MLYSDGYISDYKNWGKVFGYKTFVYLYVMGTKWMIEDTILTILAWYTGAGYPHDCHKGLQFDSEQECNDYINRNNLQNVYATEHIFMSPISTSEKLN